MLLHKKTRDVVCKQSVTSLSYRGIIKQPNIYLQGYNLHLDATQSLNSLLHKNCALLLWQHYIKGCNKHLCHLLQIVSREIKDKQWCHYEEKVTSSPGCQYHLMADVISGCQYPLMADVISWLTISSHGWRHLWLPISSHGWRHLWLPISSRLWRHLVAANIVCYIRDVILYHA